MKCITINGNDVHYKITKNNIKIIDSYMVTNKNDMIDALLAISREDKYAADRNRRLMDYVREWRTHNIFYKLPIKKLKESCKDCDLTNDESKFRLFIYSIIGRF